MPGITVSTTTRTGPSIPLKPPSAQWFVVGQSERGPENQAVLLEGMSDYDKVFGNRVSYGAIHDNIKNFFDEGGSEVWVARVVGPGATSGTLTLSDQDPDTPQPTLRLDASSPGGWSANLQVVVSAGLLPNTFRIQFLLSGKMVEDYNNITSPSQAVSRMVQSPYVTVTDLGSVTAAPANNPAPISATAMSAGNDDRANISSQTYVDALDLFDDGKGIGAVSIPGQGSAVHTGLVAHAEAFNRIAILSAAQGTSKADLISLVGAVNSEFAGLFAPWVKVDDGAGGTITISPEGYVAACRSRAHLIGSWEIPAGKSSQALALIDIDQPFTASDADDLDSAGVSIIRLISNTIRLYGYRSLSNDIANYQFLTIRDLLNVIVSDANAVLEDYVFANIDGSGQLLSTINAQLVAVLDPIATAGGLYASTTTDSSGTVTENDPGYSVDTSADVDSAAVLGRNEVVATIAVRPAPNAATIQLQIVRVGFTGTV